MKRSREPQEDIYPASPSSPDTDSSPSSPQHTSKYTELDFSQQDVENSSPFPATRITCSLPPHAEMAFDSYTAYEVHYNSLHTNRCLQCRKNFPSQHLLGIHIEEMHDPIVRVRRDQGAHTFSCFVEDCPRQCLTPQKRRLHLIDKHMYPKNFFFAVTRDGIDGRRSLLVDGGGGGRGGHRRRSSSAASQAKGATQRRGVTQAADTAEQPSGSQAQGKQAAPTAAVDPDVDAITGSMASLRFVPAAVKFGTRNRRGFAKQ